MTTILVIQTAFIGDAILASAVLENLHQEYPNANIDFLVRKGNESLYAEHPFLNEVLVWNKKEGKYRSLRKLLKKIRKRKYDTVINIHRFASSGILTAFSGAKQKIGFNKNPLSAFFNIKIPHEIGNGKHETERNYELIKSIVKNEQLPPKLYPTESHFKNTTSYKSDPYICIAPTSVWFTKQFPQEKWIELIQTIPDHFTVYLLGAPDDKEACEAIKTAVKRESIINLAGKLQLLESAALMKDAVMNYVNDSAPMHLASAMNAPVCAVYCSTTPDFGFGPLSDKSFVVEVNEDLDCRPCGLHGHSACPKGHFKCSDIDSRKMIAVIE